MLLNFSKFPKEFSSSSRKSSFKLSSFFKLFKLFSLKTCNLYTYLHSTNDFFQTVSLIFIIINFIVAFQILRELKEERKQRISNALLKVYEPIRRKVSSVKKLNNDAKCETLTEIQSARAKNNRGHSNVARQELIKSLRLFSLSYLYPGKRRRDTAEHVS